MRLKHNEEPLYDLPFTTVRLAIEHSSPHLLNSDFDFTRYSVGLTRAQRTLGAGVTTLWLYGGASERRLPLQRLFTVDFGDELFGDAINFKTLGEEGFSGDRVAAIYALHNFNQWLWRRLGVPGLRDLPLSLAIYGGLFVSSYERAANRPDLKTSEGAPPDFFREAPKAYSEIGFRIGQIPPVNVRLYFTWQLSDYDTHRFTLHWAFLL